MSGSVHRFSVAEASKRLEELCEMAFQGETVIIDAEIGSFQVVSIRRERALKQSKKSIKRSA
jgi:ATP-dependent DNA ligase